MATNDFHLRLPETIPTAMTIGEFDIEDAADAAQMARRASLLAALVGLQTEPRKELEKAVKDIVKAMTHRGLQVIVELAILEIQGKLFAQAVAVGSAAACGKVVSDDSCGSAAELEHLAQHLAEIQVENWTTDDPQVTMRVALPSGTRLPSQTEAAHWLELLQANTTEEAVVLAQRRGKQIATELGLSLARQQTPEAIAAADADRDDLETLSVVVSRSSNVIVIMDEGAMIQWVNDAFTDLTGYSQADVNGKPLNELLFGANTSRESIRDFQQALQNGLELTQDILQYHRDGRTCWVECQLIPIHDENGRLSRWIALERDITRRRQTEDALRAAKQSAEESSRAKSEFLANMSHEIRTPLNAILGMTELCLATELSNDQQEFLRTVHSSADTLLQLLNDILDLSKIEAGKMEVEETDFNLAELLGETTKALGVRAHKKQIELAVHMPMDLPQWLRGDPVRIRQILFNLVGNAIKFTQQGEIIIDVEEQWSDGEEIGLHFSVKDTGIGIPADRLKQIFDSFTQVDSSMSRRFGGTGLGLAITSELLSLMNGKIWVRSKEGEGSTFHFTMPFKLGDPQDEHALAEAKDLQGKKALIVDDNATNRRILDEMLSHWGVTTTLCESAKAAIKALETVAERGDRFDMVLLDAMMPNVDGFELAAILRERDDLRAETVMMLSSIDSANSAARCRELGIVGYLVKPFSASNLLNAILKGIGGNTAGTRKRSINGNGQNRNLSLTSSQVCKPLHILVADDHEPNRDLAVEILRRRGHHCISVADGEQAIKTFQDESFDIVLMDVQMPNMDGLTATRRIRDLQRASGIRTPIVALTAHALAGDREKCLAAGMDAYLSKPLHARRLVSLVEEIAQKTELEEDSTPSQNIRANADFDFAAALERMSGEADLLNDHMNYFLNDAPSLLDKMRSALETQDARLFEISAHRLKSLVSSYNYDDARDLALELEQMGQRSQLASAKQVLSNLTHHVQVLSDAIVEYQLDYQHDAH